MHKEKMWNSIEKIGHAGLINLKIWFDVSNHLKMKTWWSLLQPLWIF